MWNIKTKVIPVIRGAAAPLSESFTQYLSNKAGNHEIQETQKRPYWALHTYCGKYYDVKLQNIFNMRNIISCSTNCKYRTVVTNTM
jgi:hypothetical protein